MPIVTLPPGVRMTAALLKQIIEECGTCDPCGSGSGGGGRPTACCPSTNLPDTIHSTISGGTVIDGSYAMTWSPTDSQWLTPYIFQFSCFIGLSQHYMYFRLGFALDCGFIWDQVDTLVPDDFSSATPLGSFSSSCQITLTCSPFYFYYGLTDAVSGIPPRRVCDGSSSETNNICVAPWTGPKVEVTL